MKSILSPAALSLVAALAAGCNAPFFPTGSPPEGPPSMEETASVEKPEVEKPETDKRLTETREAATREDQPRRPKLPACQAKDCPQTPAAQTAMKQKPAPTALRPRSEWPTGIGPRLARMLARDELEKLAAAHVQFDVPDRVFTGTKSKVQVQLSDELRGEFVKSLQDLGMSNAEEIAAASSFRAQLSGDAFKIEAPADQEHSIGTGSAAWSWEVTPVKAGVQSLAVILAPRVKVPGGGDEEREMPPIMRKITVERGSPSGAALPHRGLWIAGGVLLLVAALGGGIMIGRRQRR
jgi:hypothetical protein